MPKRMTSTAKVTARPHPEMREGPKAFKDFRAAVKQILSVKKSDLPPDPFTQNKKTNRH
jgi:hypothetical protein